MTTNSPTPSRALPLDPAAIRAALFDMDGLLIDSERVALAAFERCAVAIALHGAMPLFRQLIGVSDVGSRPIVRDWFLRDGRSAADADTFFDAWMTDFHAAYDEQAIPLKPGVIRILDHLQHRACPCIVATSTVTPIARTKLEQAGILERFADVIGGEQVRHGKPAPDIYRLAATVAGVPASGCLVLEDSPNGVKAGVAAGMQTIQVPDLVQPDAALLALGHTVAASLDAVVDLLTER